MIFHALRVKQHGKPFFIVTLNAEVLKDEQRIKPDVWRPGTDGYQRELDMGRAKLFSRWISNSNNISPSAVLLSVREQIEFEGDDYGVLKIPDNATLYVVDGQHRIEGIRIALKKQSTLDVSIPAVIICPHLLGENEAKDPKYTEAKQFVVINRTQKRVRVDLSDMFIARLSEEQRRELEVLGSPDELMEKQIAVWVVGKLRDKEGSVWKNNIKLPAGRGKGRGSGIVSQNAFVSSLEPVTSEPKFRALSDDELADALDNYWAAWHDLCPAAFDKPEDYEIQKTHGVYVLNHLFVDVAKWLIDSNRELTKENFRDVLKDMDEGITADYWYAKGDIFRGMGTGYKAFNKHYKELRDRFLAAQARRR